MTAPEYGYAMTGTVAHLMHRLGSLCGAPTLYSRPDRTKPLCARCAEMLKRLDERTRA